MTIDCSIVSLPAKNSVLKAGNISNQGLLDSIREYSGTANGHLWDGIWTGGWEGAISEFKLVQHHLFVLADVNVHDDEWFLDVDGIWKRTMSILKPLSSSSRKIMATTDPFYKLPLLTNQFLKEYFTRIQQRKAPEVLQLEVEYWDEDFVCGMLHCDAVNDRGYVNLSFK